jgi:uncharacterized protein with ATP-grasp and redox domains
MNGEIDAFLSYNKNDREWVKELKNGLEERGIRVWWDQGITPDGKPNIPLIEDALEKSKVFVPVVSQNSLESGWVKSEINLALQMSFELDVRFRIIPVRLDETEVRGFLKTLPWIDFRSARDYQAGIEKLIMGIKSVPVNLNSPSDEDVSFALHEILSRVKKSVIVLGNTLNKFTSNDDVVDALTKLLKKGKQVKLILLNPSSSYARAHELFYFKENIESARYPMSIQSKRTIDCLRDIKRFAKSDNYKVYLSNYMPRFRTILIDDEICYVYLYMYGKDVTNTPEFIITKTSNGASAKWFATIDDSVKKLLASPHVFPIIEGNQFHDAKDWPKTDIYLTLLNCLNTRCCSEEQCTEWDKVRKTILGYQNDDEKRAQKEGLCGSNYEPGTFTIAEAFCNTPDKYDKWLDKILDDHFELIQKERPDLLENEMQIDRIKDNVRAILELRPKGHLPLKEEIWFQEYSDVIHRIVLSFIEKNVDRFYNLYSNLTTGTKDFMCEVIETLENRLPKIELNDWLYLSIAAGLLGVDEKTIHAATSKLYKREAISIRESLQKFKSPEDVAEELMEISRKHPKAKDDSGKFFEKIQEKIRNANGKDIRMVAITDDYMETMILVKYYEKLLKTYPLLSIDCIPRSTRCSNDATHEDVKDFLNLPFVTELKLPRIHERFRVHNDGPKLGGVNLRKLDEKIIDILSKADIIDVRGARNYEMMQRINKDMFFGFMVCRGISKAVTGVEIKDRPFFYLYQAPGECSFKNNYKQAGIEAI